MNTTNALGNDFNRIVRHGMHCSRYLCRLLDAEPLLLTWLQTNYHNPCTDSEIKDWLASMPIGSEEALSESLRILRKRVMLKILMRDLGGLADLNEVMNCMTALAENAVRCALSFATRSLAETFGLPIGLERGCHKSCSLSAWVNWVGQN